MKWMEDPSRFLREFKAKPPVPMNEDASAEEQSMLSLHLDLDDAPTERLDVPAVDDKPNDLEVDTPVESDAVRECRLCKHQRLRQGQSAQKMRRLPSEITQHTLFKKKSAPIQVCPECDGRVVEYAIRAHEERHTNV